MIDLPPFRHFFFFSGQTTHVSLLMMTLSGHKKANEQKYSITISPYSVIKELQQSNYNYYYISCITEDDNIVVEPRLS